MDYPVAAPTTAFPAFGHGPFVTVLSERFAPDATVRAWGIAEGVDDNGVFINIGDVQTVMSDAFGEQRVANEPDFRSERPDLINLSLGGAGCDLATPWVFGEFLDRVATPDEWSNTDDAPIIVAAAGNSSADVEEYPAAFSKSQALYPHLAMNMAAVGSMSPGNSDPDCFSNVGAWVNIWAPGTDQESYYPYGSGWAKWSGTSFSTARVSAMLATEATNANATVNQLWAEGADGTVTVPDFPIAPVVNKPNPCP